MGGILKQASIALGLIVFCIAVFFAVKAYGVWVITGVAVVLFILGLIRKDKRDGPESRNEAQDRDGKDNI